VEEDLLRLVVICGVGIILQLGIICLFLGKIAEGNNSE